MPTNYSGRIFTIVIVVLAALSSWGTI